MSSGSDGTFSHGAFRGSLTSWQPHLISRRPWTPPCHPTPPPASLASGRHHTQNSGTFHSDTPKLASRQNLTPGLQMLSELPSPMTGAPMCLSDPDLQAPPPHPWLLLAWPCPTPQPCSSTNQAGAPLPPVTLRAELGSARPAQCPAGCPPGDTGAPSVIAGHLGATGAGPPSQVHSPQAPPHPVSPTTRPHRFQCSCSRAPGSHVVPLPTAQTAASYRVSGHADGAFSSLVPRGSGFTLGGTGG